MAKVAEIYMSQEDIYLWNWCESQGDKMVVQLDNKMGDFVQRRRRSIDPFQVSSLTYSFKFCSYLIISSLMFETQFIHDFYAIFALVLNPFSIEISEREYGYHPLRWISRFLALESGEIPHLTHKSQNACQV